MGRTGGRERMGRVSLNNGRRASIFRCRGGSRGFVGDYLRSGCERARGSKIYRQVLAKGHIPTINLFCFKTTLRCTLPWLRRLPCARPEC
jgi:hypothetical protein